MKNAIISALVVASVALAGCAAPMTSATSVPSVDATPGASQKSTPNSGGVACSYLPDAAAAKPVSLPPSSGVSNSGTIRYVLSLNGQPIGLTLNRAAAPCTVNSFVSLAAQGFFDNTACHRLGNIPGSFQMLQCGDPTATGTGGPGYRYADELTGKETYPTGTVAMANAGPDTNGSQFFLVYGDTTLPSPSYTVFGTIDADGLKVLESVAAAGTDNSQGYGVGAPLAAAKITSVKPR